MTEKTVANYLYEGLGPPVELHNLKFKLFGKEYHPIINVKEVADQLMQSVLSQENKFTGDQLVFTRTYLLMNIKKFASIIKRPEQEVKDWEQRGDKLITISPNLENLIKKTIQQHVTIKKAHDEKEDNKPQNPLSSKGMFSATKKKPDKPSSTNEGPDISTGPKKKKG